MNCKTTKLRDAISFALAVGAISATGTGIAFAQDQSQPTTLDRIEVTGTRIRQVDTETSQPVLTISRGEIEKQGFSSVADILQNISAVGTPPISRAQPLSSGEAVGGTFISLRDLGAARTLVLLNGKRLGITTSGLQDISTVPVAAIERIEVLKDGASSIYGSDAIAGVINIITRSNYEGAAASVYYGQYSEGDGGTTLGDVTMGFTGERGSLTIAAEWADEKKVASADRPYSAYPRSNIHPDLGWTVVGQYGGFAVSSLFPLPGFANGRYILRDGGDPRNPADYRPQNVDSTVTADKTNTNLQTDLRTPQERRALFVDGIYDLTDNVRFRTNLMYSNRDSVRQVAGYPYQAIAFGTPMAANSYFNPLGVEIQNWWRRTWEVPRTSQSDLTTYRFSGNFEGSFEVGEKFFDWDVGYLYNQNKLVQTGTGNLNLTSLRAAVGPSFLNGDGVVQCGTATAPIALNQCVPYNPFIHFGNTGQGALSGNQALQAFLFPTSHATAETESTVFTANLAGSLFTLPAGDLGFAIGLENRKEEGAFSPDSLVQSGNTTDLANFPTNGSYTVDEVYAELQIPVLSDLPGAQELSFNVATRYSDYDAFGDTVNNKFGFKWKPIESLMIRGTIADGFRAPTINDLYGGGSQSFDFFTDPCDVQFGASRTSTAVRARCQAGLGAVNANTFRQLQQGFVPTTVASSQTPVAFLSGSNDQLTPEQSRSKNLGAVWSPGFAEGLNVALDWWEIKVENTIISDSANLILNDCYINDIAARCGAFQRDPLTGIVNYLRRTGINAGYREVEGYDLDVAYRLPTESWGNFAIQWTSTYTVRDDLVSTKNPVTHPNPFTGVGWAATDTGTHFRIRSNLNLNWELGEWGASWTARYYSGLKEACLSAAAYPDECSNPTYSAPSNSGSATSRATNELGSNTFHDLQVRWTAPWNATISVGANNVFNHVGQVFYSQPSANVSYYGGFDIGRFMYMRYTQRF
ncbi:TonB-dependent receptor plug domain-containing protein [Pseudoxanthomonas japonensis]|uniref:TonB-dependent receptor plug domain-containing protein n=1 Tax=Pseudoxanthomonas japonensis TaxID=69284 RepID=UPI001BCC4F23|nr:TonB-dependent receptor [Pseudoxanthomonas japonensis]MCR6626541.1 TonB-dependent receptor [Pseudoxanthomonas sp.]